MISALAKSEKKMSVNHGVRKRGCSEEKMPRQLAVLGQRPGKAGDADHARVRCDQQDRRGEEADVVARAVEHGAV